MKALIIGATSTIAGEVARELARRGSTLFLIGRDQERLDSLAAELRPHVVGTIAGDFCEMTENEGRVARAAEALGSLDLVLIAHGWLGDQQESERSFKHAEAVVQTNLVSVLSFVIPVTRRLETQGDGALVVLSSVAGDRGRPRNYTYGAAKGALSLYLQGLRSRLHGRRVRIVTVRLGPVHSAMTRDHPKNALFGAPPSVARSILRAAERGPLDVYVPWYWRPIMATVRALPEPLFQRFGFLAGR